MQEHRLAAQGGEAPAFSTRVRQSKIRSGHGRQQPGFNRGGQALRFLCCAWLFLDRGGHPKRLSANRIGALFYPDTVVRRKIAKLLHQPAGPANGNMYRFLGLPEAEENFLTMLREESGAGLQLACLLPHVGAQGDNCADPIAIAPSAAQSESDGWRQRQHYIAQHAKLRSIAILQEYFQPAIVIEIGQREGPAVLD